LSVRLGFLAERIILVPGLRQEISLSKNHVSSSYLEEMSALVFLPALLELSSEVVLYKRDLILKYTSGSEAHYMQDISKYFAIALEQYKKFDLSTYFTVKNMEIDQERLVVIANGILTSIYGKRGFESSAASYRLSYEFTGGELRLKEFTRIIEAEVAE
jgi:hypothetical protein